MPVNDSLNAAQEALNRKEWNAAAEYYLDALREYSCHAGALQWLFESGLTTADRTLFERILTCTAGATGNTDCDPLYAKIARTLGRPEESETFRRSAEDQLRALVAADQADWKSRQSLGNLLRDFAFTRHTLEESLSFLDGAACTKVPHASKASVLYDRAMTHRCLGDRARAEEEFTQVLALQPDHLKAHTSRSLLLLLRGEYDRGLADYEWRRKSYREQDCDPERWKGKRVLVWCEQGTGDQIQMVRFVRAVCDVAAHVHLICERGLIELFTDNMAAQAITPRWKDMKAKDLPNHDVFLPVMSLPFALRLRYEQLPWAPIPYLNSRSDRLPAPAAKMLSTAPEKVLRIGLAWAGNPFLLTDHLRSCPLTAFEPLLRIPGIAWFSLQVGLRPGDQERIRYWGLPDVGPHLSSYAATAAAIEQLDIVVSVDTSVAHVAGALGKNVAVALPYDPDWRWWQEGATTRWYPNATVFRQREIGEWGPVIADLEAWLRARLLASDLSIG